MNEHWLCYQLFMINSSSFNKKVIRFRRRGHCQYPVFEIVLTSKNKRSRGSFIEKLGFYNPNFTERLFFVDVPRMVY